MTDDQFDLVQRRLDSLVRAMNRLHTWVGGPPVWGETGPLPPCESISRQVEQITRAIWRLHGQVGGAVPWDRGDAPEAVNPTPKPVVTDKMILAAYDAYMMVPHLDGPYAKLRAALEAALKVMP